MKNERRFTIFLFAVYLSLLTWIILFKMGFSLAALRMPAARVNLIPLAGSARADGTMNWNEVVNNVLVFLPAGVYLAMLFPGRPFLQKLLPAFCLSLAYETLQFAFSIGVLDITDLIGNTLGAAAGILAYALLSGYFGEKIRRLVTVCASLCTVSSSAFLAALLLASF